MSFTQSPAQEEYDAVSTEWLKLYAPRDYREQRLIDQLIMNDWFVQQACRVLLQAEADGDWDRLPLLQRYKNTAERAFYKAYYAVGFRRSVGGRRKPEKT